MIATMDDTDVLRPIRGLMIAAAGDEKHDPSAHSTLDVLWVLYDRIMRTDPTDPRSEDRDRLIVSKGHGPQALYAVLAAKGFFPPQELSRYMARDSMLGGHPERNQVPGVEASTGSLGHGFPMAVGVALALRAARRDRRVFVLIGDGEANEGSVWETILLAGSLQLPNLTCIVVDNHSSTRPLGDIAAKFVAFGWVAVTVDGRDHGALDRALRTPDAARPGVVVADIGPAR
jgi:transketolase